MNSLLVLTLTGNCYYGIILYLDKMKGNFFINAIFTFLGELISELIGVYLTDKYGQKKGSNTIDANWNIFFILYDLLPQQFSGIIVNKTFVHEIRGTVISYVSLWID